MRAGSNEQGFTLVEVMIAILLTVIAVIGILALYMTEARSSSYTRHTTEATTLASDKLEQLRTYPVPVSDHEQNIDARGGTGGIFDRSWTVTPVGSAYLDITVYVGWNEDEAAGPACSTHAQCTVSKYCRPNSTCAGRAVIVHGRRNQ